MQYSILDQLSQFNVAHDGPPKGLAVNYGLQSPTLQRPNYSYGNFSQGQMPGSPVSNIGQPSWSGMELPTPQAEAPSFLSKVGGFVGKNQGMIGMGAGILGGMIGAGSELGDKGHKFKNVASSAVSMAGLGMSVGGPIGAAIGGGIGIVKGLFDNKAEQKAADAAKAEEARLRGEQQKAQRELFINESKNIASQHNYKGVSGGFFAKGGNIEGDTTTTYKTDDFIDPIPFGLEMQADSLISDDVIKQLAPGIFKLKGEYHKGSPKAKKGDTGVKLDTDGDGKANIEAEKDEVIVGKTILPRQYGPSDRIGGFNFLQHL